MGTRRFVRDAVGAGGVGWKVQPRKPARLWTRAGACVWLRSFDNRGVSIGWITTALAPEDVFSHCHIVQ